MTSYQVVTSYLGLFFLTERHYKAFHEKASHCLHLLFITLWLDGLDSRSEFVQSVGRSTPARCCRFANPPGTVWPVVKFVQQTEPPRCQTYLWKWWWCRWEIKAFSSTCTWLFLHTAVTCDIIIQMQDCIASKMCRFLHIFHMSTRDVKVNGFH